MLWHKFKWAIIHVLQWLTVETLKMIYKAAPCQNKICKSDPLFKTTKQIT